MNELNCIFMAEQTLDIFIVVKIDCMFVEGHNT